MDRYFGNGRYTDCWSGCGDGGVLRMLTGEFDVGVWRGYYCGQRSCGEIKSENDDGV